MVRYDMIGSTATFFASILALSGHVSPGIAGIAVTQTQSLTQSFYWISRNWTALEQDANSVERVIELITETPQEEPVGMRKPTPPAYWPTEGVVEVKELEVRYASELPAVLKNISFKTRPHEKIGVVGSE